MHCLNISFNFFVNCFILLIYVFVETCCMNVASNFHL